MVDFSIFLSFWVISAIVDRVSRALMVGEGVVESEEVIYGVDEEKIWVLGIFSNVK